MRVNPRRHESSGVRVGRGRVRERHERRDADHPPAADERQPLHRRNTDAQTGERSGAGGHGEQIDVGETTAARIEHRQEIARKTLRVRTRRIAARLVHGAVVVDERHASRSRRRVQRQHTHALD